MILCGRAHLSLECITRQVLRQSPAAIMDEIKFDHGRMDGTVCFVVVPSTLLKQDHWVSYILEAGSLQPMWQEMTMRGQCPRVGDADGTNIHGLAVRQLAMDLPPS